MRVLLVGEFSGVHNNLKKGLEELGVKVTLANTGDGYRKFGTDIKLKTSYNGKIGEFMNKLLEMFNYLRMQKYDVIQFINPATLYTIGYDSKKILKLLDKTKLSVCLACGCDNNFSKYYQNINSNLCKNCEIIDMRKKHSKCIYAYDKKYISYERKVYDKMDIIVPMAWEYYKIYKDYNRKYADKIANLIPFAVDVERIKPNYTVNNKLVVYHPLNREGFKGTLEIRKAFKILQGKYGDKVRFVIRGKIAFDKYMKLVEKTDIMVDQAYSVSCGMAALNAMAQGKIVITGNAGDWKEINEIPWLAEMPKFDLGHGVDEIVETISRVIDNKEKFIEYKKASRAYVEKYHDAIIVAKQFLDLYEKNIKNK